MAETQRIVVLTESELEALIERAVLRALGRGGSDDRLLDAKEAGKILGQRHTWVYDQAKKGDLSAIKMGRYWRFSAVALRKWIEEKQTNK